MYKLFQLLNNKQKKNLIIIFFLMIIVSFLDTLSLSSIIPILKIIFDGSINNNFFNKVVSQAEDSFGLNSKYYFIAITLFVFLFKNIFLYIQTKFVANFMLFLSVDQQRQTFEKYISKKYYEMKKEETSSLLRNVNQESKLITSSFLGPLLTFFINLTTIIFISIFLLLYNFKITLPIIITSILFFALINKLYKKILENFGLKRQQYSKDTLKSIKETFDGYRELTIYNKLDFYLENFSNKITRLANMGTQRAIISVIPKIFLEIFLILSICLILFATIYNEKNIDNMIIDLSIYLLASLRLLPTLISLISSFQKMNYSKASLDLIYNILKSNPKNIILPTNEKKIIFNDSLKIQNLSFRYDDKIIFNNFNLIIPKNSFIGIQGESGCGKSTLIDLISGITNPDSGQILIDQRSIYNNLNSYRLLIGYLQQKIFIFNKSITSNITLEDDISKIDKKEFNNLINFCGLETFIDNFQTKENTLLGEFGNNISGGQVQRIGLARALYRKPKILLIDEGLNNLDETNKKLILQRLVKLKDKTTIIYVSHDVEDLNYCDSVVTL